MSFKEIRVGEYALRFYPSDNGWMCGITPEMMDALEQAEKQTALDRMADNARELGLDYTPMQEPVAMRYDFDGYGYKYIDSGSGSDWQTRHKSAEPLYEAPPQRQPPQFPTMLRKMWSGAEVQAWINKNWHGIGGGE